jgi:hypothetical protein
LNQCTLTDLQTLKLLERTYSFVLFYSLAYIQMHVDSTIAHLPIFFSLFIQVYYLIDKRVN